jgi:hypothetical protein
MMHRAPKPAESQFAIVSRMKIQRRIWRSQMRVTGPVWTSVRLSAQIAVATEITKNE